MLVDLILLVFGVWLSVISVILYHYFALFKKLSNGVNVTDLKSVLEKVLASNSNNEKIISGLTKKVNLIETEGELHVQKIGLVRFNPFRELGSDHSFSLAILNGEGSGIIITSLHTRDRTRVYMKEIKKGKSDTELSAEEKKALTTAK